MLNSHEYFQFFRDAVGQSKMESLTLAFKFNAIALISMTSAAVFMSIALGIVLCIDRYKEFRQGSGPHRGCPDTIFGLAALFSVFSFLPYHFQYEYGAPSSLMPRKSSDKANHYLDPPRVTPEDLAQRWLGVAGQFTYSAGLSMLVVSILLIIHVFVELIALLLRPQ